MARQKKVAKKKVKSNKKYAPKSILLTGAAGFIGSNVLRYLWEKYPKVKFYVLDALTYAGDMRNIPDYIHNSNRFEFLYGDIRNERLVDYLMSRCDTVVHFAAETHVARSIFDNFVFFETDVLGTQVISNAVLRHNKNIKKFIHISTSEVYGTSVDSGQMSEKHPLEPCSPYAAAKAGADRLVYSYIATYGIPATIIRPFNIFGPNQHLEKLIPRFITNVLMGEPMTMHGKGKSFRDFTFVTDLAHAIELVIEAPDKLVEGEVFNVGNDEAISVAEIASLIKKILPTRLSRKLNMNKYTVSVGDRPGQVAKHWANSTKIRKRLGWKPKVKFEDGLKKTIDWYIANEDWWLPKVNMRYVMIETDKGKFESQ